MWGASGNDETIIRLLEKAKDSNVKFYVQNRVFYIF